MWGAARLHNFNMVRAEFVYFGGTDQSSTLNIKLQMRKSIAIDSRLPSGHCESRDLA